MGTDRKHKKEVERKNKKLTVRKQDHLRQLRDKALEYAYYANAAFKSKSYSHAYELAMQGLGYDARNFDCYATALNAAIESKDDELIYSVLGYGWQYDFIKKQKRNLLVYANFCITHKEIKRAYEVLQYLFDASSEFHDKLPENLLNRASALREYCCHELEKPQKTAPPAPQQLRKDIQKKKDAMPSSPSPAAAHQEKTQQAGKPDPGSAISPASLAIEYTLETACLQETLRTTAPCPPERLELTLQAYQISLCTSYDQLICLPTLKHVRSFWYQEETAQKVMKYFRGRAILADEVGLGKTIEAGLVLKEYILRGLVNSALILTPSGLVNQWQEELAAKFDLTFSSTNDPLLKSDAEAFWKQPYILASLQTAKSKRHFEAVTRRTYDMVIVDEAHHLKNSSTLNWKLVDRIPKTYILLLTATPVQNNLEELYNLVTLLKPGHLKTRRAFIEEFVASGNPTDPINRERLRELLKEVMVRNTRSVAQLNLPPRFASTLRLEPAPEEKAFYEATSDLVAKAHASTATKGLALSQWRRLLEAAGSSIPSALKSLAALEKHAEACGLHAHLEDLTRLGKNIAHPFKFQQALKLINASTEQKIIFVNHFATLEAFHQLLKQKKMEHALYHGSLPALEKTAAMHRFEGGCPLLLTSESGGEGHNLQFCHTMINLDLPWNPMQIEQRIGRLHRIGQEHEVKIYNLCSAGTLEDYILEVLDKKINMFELVIGELDMILGRIENEQDFSDIVYDLWVTNPEEQDRQKAFQSFGTRLKRARGAYDKSRELDEKLFREDFGV